MQKMLIVSSVHYAGRYAQDQISGVIELNNHLKSGWKVVNMQESSTVGNSGVIFNICYVVIEKK